MATEPYITPPRDGNQVDRWRQRVSELLNQISDGIDVNVQDQTTEIIDLHLSELKSVLTLTASTSIGDRSITGDVAAGYTVNVGEIVCLKESTAFYQGEIITAVDNGSDNWTLTLDTPLDYAFTTAGGCSVRNINANVDGSSATKTFSISPADLVAGTQWDVVRIIIVLEDDTSMDTGKFGGITKLTNGVVFRSVDGTTKNIFNAKTNGDFASHSFDVSYDDKAPAGTFGFRCRSTFGGQSKRGVVVRLSADTSDTFEMLVQDNLTELSTFHVVVQGHVVDP